MGWTFHGTIWSKFIEKALVREEKQVNIDCSQMAFIIAAQQVRLYSAIFVDSGAADAHVTMSVASL
jgi:hypothetical protein